MPNHKTVNTLFVLIIPWVAFCSTGFAEDNKELIPGSDSGFYDTIKKKDPPAEIKTSFSFSQIDHTGFIKKEAQPSLGSVLKEEENNLIMSTHDIIYIKPSNRGPLVPGTTYQIFSTETINRKIGSQKFTGIKHLIKAKIKILEHKTTYATALIIENYHAVLEGDRVMEYYKRNPILTVEDHPDPINAILLCSEENALMINDHEIAFISIGKERVKPGEIYRVLRKNKFEEYVRWPQAKKENAVDLENLESGKLIVLHTEDIASTVMILSSKYAIHPDDMVN